MSPSQAELLAARYCGAAPGPGLTLEDYADNYLELILETHDIKALDYSAYEGCDIVHDLNTPIGPELHGRFDAVIDGGCLEHIFNVPMALANYMNLVRNGGSLFIATMANNHMGHGFYQFE